MRVVFKGGHNSRAGTNCGNTVFDITSYIVVHNTNEYFSFTLHTTFKYRKKDSIHSLLLLSFIFIHCLSEEETALAEAIAAPPKYEAINMRMIAK